MLAYDFPDFFLNPTSNFHEKKIQPLFINFTIKEKTFSTLIFYLGLLVYLEPHPLTNIIFEDCFILTLITINCWILFGRNQLNSIQRQNLKLHNKVGSSHVQHATLLNYICTHHSIWKEKSNISCYYILIQCK